MLVHCYSYEKTEQVIAWLIFIVLAPNNHGLSMKWRGITIDYTESFGVSP